VDDLGLPDFSLGVAHLSDPHITTGPLGALPAARLHAALGRALGLDPRPQLIVITGDLTDHGTPDEYAALREILRGYPLPVFLAAGNHDDPAALRGEFAGTPQLAGGDATYYTVDAGGARLIVLDSWIPQSPGGRLGDEQLAWLDKTLAQEPDRPTLVALHHPPLPLAISLLDTMRLDDADAFAEVIRPHRQIGRILCGHGHRTITTTFAGTVLTMAPSTYRQTTLTMRPDERTGYADEPTAFLLHLLGRGGDWVTHVVQVSHTGASIGGYWSPLQ
jgi:3',5'-cyclic AMP phosphodiesterase CpdA